MSEATGTAGVMPFAAPHEIDRSGDPLVSAQGVWKIFGAHADRGSSRRRMPSCRAASCDGRPAARSPCATCRWTSGRVRSSS